MPPYFLAIPLPSPIRVRLATFCHGLPQVRWLDEENLYFILQSFGPLTDLVAHHIHEELHSLFFPPFTFILQEIHHSHTKTNRGSIWVGVEENLQLISLKNEIQRHLRPLRLSGEEFSFQLRVNLGFYEKINPSRLGDYLAAYADFRSAPIEVKHILFLRSHYTQKRINMEILGEYTASQIATGED